jgi:hypothetical protein
VAFSGPIKRSAGLPMQLQQRMETVLNFAKVK